MIAFLPVTRYLVRFTVARGRPYSVFERFLLEALSEGPRSLDELVAFFKVHRRVVVEGLVSLMHARWIARQALPNTTVFVRTPLGQEALRTPSLPERQVSQDRPTYLVMEHIAGQIARGSSVTFRPMNQLKRQRIWELGVRILPTQVSRELEMGRARPFLRVNVENDEYVQSINDIRPDGVTTYILVDVDTKNGVLKAGSVPADWESLLTAEVVEQVRRHENFLQQKGTAIDDKLLRHWLKAAEADSGSQGDCWQIALEQNDFFHGTESHASVLENRLQRAKSTVVLACPSLNVARLRQIVPHFQAAINRKVNVDILWGIQPDSTEEKHHLEALHLLQEIERQPPSTGGRLMVAKRPSKSIANVLLSDPEGRYEAIVGSNEWLGPLDAQGRITTSTRFSHPGPLSRLCYIVADMLAADPKLQTSGILVGVRNNAARLERALLTLPKDQYPVQCRILYDEQHRAAFKDAIMGARKSFVLACKTWDATDAVEILNAFERASGFCSHLTFRYGAASLRENAREEWLALLNKQGAQTECLPTLASNYVIVDDDVLLLSSTSWLSQPSGASFPGRFGIGVWLNGTGICRTFLGRGDPK